ncbi:hypothetical protein VI817_001137 [Penicillium citrinum]|nr:hypothetical protein VI817_001137 [Penicillium citrinum]
MLHPSSLLRPVRKVPRYSVRPFYTTIVVFTTLATLSTLIAWFGKGHVHPTSTGTLLFKREDEPECRLVREVADQCAYVRKNCPDHQDGLFSYLQLYYCALPNAKPLAFLILILWLSLLFSTIGIAASDFLCIDLSTLASILGLSESLTGVTFLAFGNGSPDVFSTFAAMRSNSGSLAIGELIGAASFITSVVAGSMALVRPFKVARRSFVRDVGYFIVAISFSMFLLADGRLHVWESAAMVALYAFYVVMVVTWHWYLVRRRKRHERDMAARTHAHIPGNQELDYEIPVDDDDPGVADSRESRSLLRGTSTDDFNLLERAERTPSWKEEEDEDDETRNRYLAEIRDNMHLYRPPNRSRRNTMNPIRPSLVGALEFQSVLHSLEKSRNIRHRPTISLGSYSDDGDASSQTWDTRSVASHPRATRPAGPNDRLSPHSAEGSRARAVSANDADRLELDPSILGRHQGQAPQLTVRRPSGEVNYRPSIQPPRIDTSVAITVSPSESTQASPGGSPVAAAAPQTPDLLAPPGTFNSPNYQTGATQDRSPQAVSPRGTSGNSTSMLGLSSPSAPFPSYVEEYSAPSSRASSIRLPNTVASPSEQLLVHDNFDDMVTERSSLRGWLRKWWPSSVLPPPRQIGYTLFPTVVGWKGKGITGRFLAVVAAPSVFLLTITVPVVEPQGPEYAEPDPLPSVVIEQFDTDESAPRVRLPADSPVLHSIGHGRHDSIPDISIEHPHLHKASHQNPPSRPRWDSELPAAPPPPTIEPETSAKDSNRWLISIQLFTGPFFFTLIAWITADTSLNPRNFILPSLISLLFSFICLAFLIITTRQPSQHRPIPTNPTSEYSHHELSPRPLPYSWRPVLSLLGFLVAISWIATIATEVVSLLKTIGVILDISDSLLGLTVFAVGNSLGDLVADITVARLGYPVMALSACFGGPMLNILLGIGLGGLYMTLNRPVPSRRDEIFPGNVQPAEVPYEIEISKVLVISGATLLIVLVGLLIVVPLNNWRMDRRIGWGLVVVWCISTIGNVIAEINS